MPDKIQPIADQPSRWLWKAVAGVSSILCCLWAFAADRPAGQQKVVVEQSAPVTMRDGVTLRDDVCRPEHRGPFPSSLNVKDFGAKGDGKDDDTKAIQAAADEAARLEAAGHTKVGTAGGLTHGSKGSSYPEVYFPAGTYKTSDVVVWRSSVVLRGEPGARIVQSDPVKDVFYLHYGYRNAVQDLALQGGKTQLKLWTGNNWARLLVRNCTFSQSADYAVECRCFTEKRLSGDDWRESKPWPPYLVETDGGKLLSAKPNTAETLLEWYNSTLLVIDGCVFDQCKRAANVCGDLTLLNDCRILLSKDTDGAPFKLDGQTRVRNLQGRGLANSALDQFWIETEGDLSLRGVDLQVEGPKGIGFIRSETVPKTTNRSLRLQDCTVKVGGSTDSAIVVVDQGTMPSLIAMENVTETSGQEVQAIKWRSRAPLGHGSNTARELQGTKDVPPKRRHVLVLDGLGGNITAALPEEMKALLQDPVPRNIMQSVEVAAPTLAPVELVPSQVILAEEHGVVRDSAKDQTEAIQRLCDFAGKSHRPLVVFPGAATFLLSKTISLPKNIRIKAAGVSFFKQRTAGADIFRAEGAELLAVANCDFIGGKDAVSLTTAPAKESLVVFDYCSFFDQSEAGIRCLSTEEGKEVANRTRVVVTNGVFRAHRGLITNAGRSFLDGFWANNDPHLNDAAFFENRGGEMRVQNMLGNPSLWAGRGNKRPPEIKDWHYSTQVRWFDNWGRLHCQDIRFGGESGGMCNVQNNSADGTVLIEGGLSRSSNDKSVTAILHVPVAPNLAVLRNIASPLRQTRIQMFDGTTAPADNKTLFISGLLTP